MLGICNLIIRQREIITIGNKRKFNYQYIGLIAGIVIGAIVAHVEYDKWHLGALVGSGLGPMIGYALKQRFSRD